MMRKIFYQNLKGLGYFKVMTMRKKTGICPIKQDEILFDKTFFLKKDLNLGEVRSCVRP